MARSVFYRASFLILWSTAVEIPILDRRIDSMKSSFRGVISGDRDGLEAFYRTFLLILWSTSIEILYLSRRVDSM